MCAGWHRNRADAGEKARPTRRYGDGTNTDGAVRGTRAEHTAKRQPRDLRRPYQEDRWADRLHAPSGHLSPPGSRYTPWPVAYTETPKERLRILEAKVVAHSPASPGEIIRADKESLIVSCGEDALELVTVQRPGGKPVTGAQYAQGASLKTGERLVAAS